MKDEMGRYLVVPTNIIRDKGLSPTDKFVYGYIFSLCGVNEEYCYASDAVIADELAVDERTVRSAIAALKAANKIVQEGSGVERKLYLILSGKPADRTIQHPGNPRIKRSATADQTIRNRGSNDPRSLYIDNLLDKQNDIIALSHKSNEEKKEEEEDGQGSYSPKHFLTIEELDYSSDPRYVNAGQRPLRKYPSIWLTATALNSLIELYKSSGLSIQYLRNALAACVARLETKTIGGERTERVAVEAWLRGWALQQELINFRNTLKTDKFGPSFENLAKG